MVKTFFSRISIIVILPVVCMLFSIDTFSQPFNRKLPLCDMLSFVPSTSNYYSLNTVVKDQSDNIVLLGTNYSATVELIKLDNLGNFMFSQPITNPYPGYLTPISILPTYDDGFFVVGHYWGPRPQNFPPHMTPGQVYLNSDYLLTIFFAKFDNSFNLIDFRLHHGYPHNYPLYDQSCQAVNISKGTEANGDEFYLVLSEAEFRNAPSPSPPVKSPVITKLDKNLNVVVERFVDLPAMGLTTHPNMWQKIEYMERSETVVITGFIDTLDLILTYNNYPFVVTIDKNLNFLTPATLVRLPNDEQDSQDPGFNFIVLNAVEDALEDHLIWGFPVKQMVARAGEYGMCDDGPFYSLNGTQNNLFVLKQKISDLSLVNYREIVLPPCQSIQDVSEIRNFNERVLVGFTEEFRHGSNAGWGFNALNEKPALFDLDYDLNPLNHRVYNLYDYTGYGDGSTNIDNWLHFRSFMRFNNQTPILIRASTDWGGSSSTQVYTRIIGTDPDNFADDFCGYAQEYQEYVEQPEIFQIPVVAGYSETQPVAFHPILGSGYFDVVDCENGKPASAKEIHNSSQVIIYPNPAQDLCKVSLLNIGSSEVHIKLTSITGSTILDKTYVSTASNFQTELDLKDIPRGIYMVEVSAGMNKIINKLIIK